MSSCTQRLLDNFPTLRTNLAGVVRWNSNCCYTKYLAKIFQPTPESRPRRIRNRLSKFPILNHVSHLQVLIGNQVVRLDYASCQFHSKIFTLPTYLEVFSAQSVSRFGSVNRSFLSSRKPSTEPFERFFRLPEMPGIVNCMSIRVGVEVIQPNIQPNSFTRWFSSLHQAFHTDAFRLQALLQIPAFYVMVLDIIILAQHQ